MSRRMVWCCGVVISGVLGAAWAAEPRVTTEPRPEVTGDWVGVWGPYNPAKSATLDEAQCKVMDCSVTEKDGVWEATFAGECGRPYKYTITMEGRQSGKTVLFKGTADLGEKDGGIHDWVGRATEEELIGFYTSAYHTGTFHLKRKNTVGGE